jgi:AcrR family transcriptional regulator
MPPIRTPLSRERIVQAALDLIDESGLDALSMRKLGSALGVEAMSLYNHVASKEDLLGAVADLLLETVVVPPGGGDWRADLHRLCDAVRRVGSEHPQAFTLLVTQPRASLDAWHPVLVGFETVQQVGLSDEQAVAAVNVLASYVVGFVLFETNSLAMAVSRQTELLHNGQAAEDRRLLRRFVAARPHQNHDDAFHNGLDVIISGIVAGVTGRD